MVGFMNAEAWPKPGARASSPSSAAPGQALDEGRDVRQQAQGRSPARDCDDDTLLVLATRLGDGNVCHTGERTCFFKELA